MGEDELDINSHKGDLWNEVERLREAIERHIETDARDDYNARHWGREANGVPWSRLSEDQRAVYRGAVANDFWREG